LKAVAAAGWTKSTVTCAGERADAFTANDGSIHVWVKGPAGWFALHFHPLGDRKQAAPAFRRILASFAFIPIHTLPSVFPPEAAPFKSLANWTGHGSGAGYFGCEDVCKERPKRYGLFWMEADTRIDPRDRSDVDYIRQLSDKVLNILNQGGWQKCKSMYDDNTGGTTDTYSKDKSFLRLGTGART
jgi:hypothetical protein